MMNMSGPGLGRIHAPDDNDLRFQMRRALPRRIERTSKFWPYFTKWINQGPEGTCVGHGWKHWMLTAPIIQTRPTTEPLARTIYTEAIAIDEWPQNDWGDMQFGTSVRAGAKVLLARGFLTEYGWAWDVDTIIDWLCTQGPVVLGTNWYRSMFERDAERMLKIPPGDPVEGGHCYALDGWDQKRGRVRGRNSHPSFGLFYMDGETLDRLMRENGEACTALEIRRAA